MSKELQNKFEQLKKLAIDKHTADCEFAKLVENKYGFHYSDRDLDQIIECLEYGWDSTLTFKKFEHIMQEASDAQS